MEELIKSKLKEIEEKENIKILHCVESGSRAWGFASPDSDYDVRFIYVRPKEFYLRLDKTRDVIEWQLDGTLDINGWDISKALSLLYKSNPTLFEWMNSPVIYRKTEFANLIQPYLDRYFSCKSGLYHYLSMAEGNYRDYLKGDMVKAKKYFYVLRPILACKWILHKHTRPPMLFQELVESELENSMKSVVETLLDLKMNAPEVKLIPRIDMLNQYLDATIQEVKEQIASIPYDKDSDWEALDRLFIDVLRRWNT